MTIEPAVLIGAIATLGGLLIFVVRLFLTGSILPRSAVTREDYEAQRAVIASLVAAIPPLTDAVKGLTVTVESLRNGRHGAT